LLYTALVPLMLYISVVVATSFYIAIKLRKLSAFPIALIAGMAIHFSYALGFLVGLIRGGRKLRI